MKDIDRLAATVERLKSELNRLKDVNVPLIEDKEEVVFKRDFPFKNHLAENWNTVHQEFKEREDQLYKFFEHDGSEYVGRNSDGIKVNYGTYYTFALMANREPYKWFKAMFPKTCKLLEDTPEIYNAGFVICGAESGLAPHYGPKAEQPDWPLLRGQCVIVSDNQSLLCQLKTDKIYMVNQVEGDNFYFDDCEMHWVTNYSKVQDSLRVVMVYDFIDKEGHPEWRPHKDSPINILLYNLAKYK